MAEEVTSIAVTNDQRTVAYGMRSGSVTVLDAATGKKHCQLKRPSGAVRCLAFSSDDPKLALGTEDKAVEIWG